MCGPIVGLALTIASSFAQAMLTGAMAKEQAKIEQEQLRTEIANEKIKGIADTNDRLEQFRKDEATNRAALSVSGIDNVSYMEGIEPANRAIMRRDARAIEFNMGQEIGRKKYEISVAGWKAKTTRRSALIEAGVRSATDVGSYLASGNSFSSSGGGSSNAVYPNR